PQHLRQVRFAERQRARQFVVPLVERAAGHENPDHGWVLGAVAPDAGPAIVDWYSALNSIGNVACVCARCCGRRPNSTTRPGFMSIATTAARPAINSSPFSHPDATTSVFG